LPHSIILKTEQSRLEACSAEPIRTPGTIQPHGALLGINRETRLIVVVSENSEEFLGVGPERVLGRTIEEFVGEAAVPSLRNAVTGANPVRVEVNGQALDAIVHRTPGPITFVEVEPHTADGAWEGASAVYAASQRLAEIDDTGELLANVTTEVAALTGFDRIMVYDFHPDGHGEVVAETRVDGMEPYLGLHFPASDIPVQARDLYLTKLSRAIVSTSAPNVALVTLPSVDALELDLSTAELRSVSPFHLQFMRNMGQASTVSLSLVHRGRLIGMITCAHNTERRLPFFLRRSLEMLARQVALQLGTARERVNLERELHTRELRTALLGKFVASDDLAVALLDGEITAMHLVPADAAAVRLDGAVSRTTGAPSLTGMEALRRAAGRETLQTSALATSHPELARLLPGTAGVLFVPLSPDGDYLAFFRREVLQSVNWLGDLAEQNRATVLSPRVSFSAWTQSVSGTSLPWGGAVGDASNLAHDIESALVRRTESRLATLALHDPLTGLANRRFLMEELAHVMTVGGDTSLLFLDLDDFKAINDTHGHEAGDDVIVEVARRLVEQTRAEDRVARLGGDEFVILCAGTVAADAEAMADRIVAAMRAPFGPHAVTASIGVVTVREGSSPADILQLADAAMYRAKQAGRDRFSS